MPIASGMHYFLHEGGKSTRPPLVLVHGAGSDYLSWPPQIRGLSGETVFALDLPGHGKSTGSGCQLVEDYATCVVHFLDRIGLSRAVFVGHALGGAIALTLALDRPERVAGIGLISCGPRLPITSSILEDASNPATFPLAVRSLQDLMNIPFAASRIKDQSFNKISTIRPTLYHGDLCACDHFDVSTRLKLIRTPTLVVCGLEDKLTPRHFSEQLAGGIPHAALQTIDGAGHLVMLEQPRRIAGILTVFLSNLSYVSGV